MKIREFLYDKEWKRVVMRFAEIFVLAGVSALLRSVELENAFVLAFGSATGAALLKLLRDLTQES